MDPSQPRARPPLQDNQWTGKTDVTGGLGGKFPATGQSFGGDPGAVGTTFVSDKLPAVYDNLSCK